MAAITISRTISGTPDMRISLNNAAVGRLISLPSTWLKVRVGLIAQWTDAGGNLTGTPRFAFGLGSGVTNLVNSASCTHFVGVITTPATWTRGATCYTVGTTAASGCTKIGSTITTSGDIVAGGTVGYPFGATTSAANRAFYCIDITKGSPNYTFECFWLCSSTSSPDFTHSLFLPYMECNEDNPVSGNYTYTTVPQTLAVSEATNGVLNAVHVWWNGTTADLEFSSLAWGILA